MVDDLFFFVATAPLFSGGPRQPNHSFASKIMRIMETMAGLIWILENELVA